MPRASPPPARSRRLVSLVAFGASLARRGPLAAAALAISALTAVAAAAIGVVLARRGAEAPIHHVPVIASSAIGWGGAFLHLVAASASALRRDGAEGIRHLVLARTTSLRGYVVARVGGLALWAAVATAGGALLAGVITAAVAPGVESLARTVGATASAFVFGVAFAAVLAPIALASLGARPRATGYLMLLAIVVVPEVVTEALSGPIPSEIAELCAVPSALAALRTSLSPGSFDPFRAARALVALGVFGGLAFALVVRTAAQLDAPGAGEPT